MKATTPISSGRRGADELVHVGGDGQRGSRARSSGLPVTAQVDAECARRSASGTPPQNVRSSVRP